VTHQVLGRFFRTTAIAVVGLLVAVVPGGPAGAEPDPRPARQVDIETRALFEAMQRDLGLTRAQAVQRFADEQVASDLAARLETQLGAEFAGAWFDETTGRLAVGVTTATAADRARAAGAAPQVVRYSLAELQAAMTELDDLQRAAPARMADAISWGVDPQRNALVVTVRTGRSVPTVTDMVGRRGDQLRVEESDEVPSFKWDYLDGGDPMGPSSSWHNCSVGFNVYKGTTPYALTAGHCGKKGDWSYSKGVLMGTFQESWFPTYDDALLKLQRLDYWAYGPWVSTYSWDDLVYNVRGLTINVLNGSMCKSGMTTKITCGNLKAFGQTVQYDDGSVVHNMTRHTACVKSGDSGGANVTWPSSDGRVSALGMTSGAVSYYVNGVEKCGHEVGKKNEAWFQPIGPSLSYYGVKLYTV
jgi:streptogrisin C